MRIVIAIALLTGCSDTAEPKLTMYDARHTPHDPMGRPPCLLDGHPSDYARFDFDTGMLTIALFEEDFPRGGLPADPDGNDAWFTFDSASPVGSSKLPGLGVVTVEDLKVAEAEYSNFEEMTKHVPATWHECLNTTDL
jgi:hypothetical protein